MSHRLVVVYQFLPRHVVDSSPEPVENELGACGNT